MNIYIVITPGPVVAIIVAIVVIVTGIYLLKRRHIHSLHLTACHIVILICRNLDLPPAIIV